MERVIAILLLFLVCNTGYCQLKPLTKKELKTLIKESIIAKKEYYSASWIICNKDSTYFKHDTLLLHGNISNTSHLNDCCEYIGWNFTNKKRMYQSSKNTCKPPVSIGKVLTEYDFYKIRIIHKQNKLLLQRYNKGRLIDSYEVLGYSETQYGNNYNSPSITLVRQ
jgi:hypothetical protein